MKKQVEILVNIIDDSKFHEVIGFGKTDSRGFSEQDNDGRYRNYKTITVALTEKQINKIKNHIENIGTVAISEAGAVRYL